MRIVAVNTNKTKKPAGWWNGKPETAADCDYLVEEIDQKVANVYIFSGVSERDSEGRFSFKNLRKVDDTMITDRIKRKLNLTREPGCQNPLRYFDI